MNRNDAHEAVARALAGVAPEAELGDLGGGEPMRAALDLDSLDFLSLVENLQQETGVVVPEADYARVATLDGLIDYLVAAGS